MLASKSPTGADTAGALRRPDTRSSQKPCVRVHQRPLEQIHTQRWAPHALAEGGAAARSKPAQRPPRTWASSRAVARWARARARPWERAARMGQEESQVPQTPLDSRRMSTQQAAPSSAARGAEAARGRENTSARSLQAPDAGRSTTTMGIRATQKHRARIPRDPRVHPRAAARMRTPPTFRRCALARSRGVPCAAEAFYRRSRCGQRGNRPRRTKPSRRVSSRCCLTSQHPQNNAKEHPACPM